MILVGAGGHALSIAEFANDTIMGYLSKTPNPELPGVWFGDDSAAPELAKKGFFFHISYIYSGLPRMEKRRRLIEEYEKSGCRFETVVAPSAIITPHSYVGEGCAIMQGAIINRAKLGKNCVINSGAIIEHDCEVGDNTFIGPGVVVGGFTTIGENCFIGLGAKIGNNVKIGDNITVAMGAVVSGDLTEPGIYHGFPLRCFKCK